jgi:hypothetical protein
MALNWWHVGQPSGRSGPSSPTVLGGSLTVDRIPFCVPAQVWRRESVQRWSPQQATKSRHSMTMPRLGRLRAMRAVIEGFVLPAGIIVATILYKIAGHPRKPKLEDALAVFELLVTSAALSLSGMLFSSSSGGQVFHRSAWAFGITLSILLVVAVGMRAWGHREIKLKLANDEAHVQNDNDEDHIHHVLKPSALLVANFVGFLAFFLAYVTTHYNISILVSGLS